MSGQFIGEIKIVPYSFAPRGWADCDGQLLPISSNVQLFSLLGTTYGGDGSTTFGLPDLRARVPIHINSADSFNPQYSTYNLGQTGGTESQTLTITQMPNHNHDLSTITIL